MRATRFRHAGRDNEAGKTATDDGHVQDGAFLRHGEQVQGGTIRIIHLALKKGAWVSHAKC